MKTFRLVRPIKDIKWLKNSLYERLLKIRIYFHFWLTPRSVILGLTGVILVTGFGIIFVYGHRPVLLADLNGHVFNEPIQFSFDRPIKANVTVKWREKVEGTWQVKKSLSGVEQVSFTPKASFSPGTSLHAEFVNVEPTIDIASGTKPQQVVKVGIEKTPDIVGQVPVKDAKNVQISGDLSVRLAYANHGLRKLLIKTTGLPIDEVPTSSDDVTFTWKLKQPLEQGKRYEAEIIDANQPAEKSIVGRYVFETVSEPQATTDHSGFIVPGSVVTFTFDKPMNKTQTLFEKNIPGRGEWVSDTQYKLSIVNVSPGEAYTLTVKKGAAGSGGGVIMQDKQFSFSTPGKVRVIGSSPSGDRVSTQSAVALTFDQPVERSSAEKAFSISPKVDGSFSWSGNTLTFHPNGFQYQATYTVALAADVTPVFGLPGVAFSKSFTTTYETVKLGVPQFFQTHALSCEESSLRMALALYGISTTDDEVLSRVGYAPQLRDTATNTWQDPNEMFVGNVDGVESVTGWGVFARPIARVARSYGRGADVLINPSVQQVSAAIRAGNPVIVWGIIGATAKADSWNTASGGVVYTAKNAHVRVVYGVDGSADNPINFHIRDPLKAYGSLTWSASKLQSNMAEGGGQAVIVR